MEFKALLDAQRVFFNSNQTKDIVFRKQALLKIKSILKNNEHNLYQAIYKDFKKGELDTFVTELQIIYSEIDYFTKNLKRLSKVKRVNTPWILWPATSKQYKDPLGCTLIIGAWNYPYQLTLLPMISALAAGNTCVIKPSELPVHSMELLQRLFNESFNSNYIYFALGDKDVTQKLLDLQWDKIFFTGSPSVGKIVYQAAAKNLTPVTLELGGKSPGIVSRTANLAICAKRLVWGKFLNAGQTCIAPDYLLVEKSVVHEFIKELIKTLKEFNYFDGAPHYTSIINEKHFNRILGLIDPEKVIYGGSSNSKNLYIEPTIIKDIGWEDPIMQQEIFGPLLPIIVYEDFQQTIACIKQRPKSLAAYLFTQDEKEKSTFTNELSFGGGCINDTLMHVANINLPFGGIGLSGMGAYHGETGFNSFTHNKSILSKALWGEPNWKYPPYTPKKLAWLKKIF